jgi:hypothetical protein
MNRFHKITTFATRSVAPITIARMVNPGCPAGPAAELVDRTAFFDESVSLQFALGEN